MFVCICAHTSSSNQILSLSCCVVCVYESISTTESTHTTTTTITITTMSVVLNSNKYMRRSRSPSPSSPPSPMTDHGAMYGLTENPSDETGRASVSFDDDGVVTPVFTTSHIGRVKRRRTPSTVVIVNGKGTGEFCGLLCKHIANRRVPFPTARVDVTWDKKYPDGCPRLRFEGSDVDAMKGKTVVLPVSIMNTDNVSDLWSTLDIMKTKFQPSRLILIILCFAVGTQDRETEEYEIPTGASVCRQISQALVNFTNKEVVILDIHNPVLTNSFDPVPCDSKSLMVVLLDHAFRGCSDNSMNVIVFPDDGARKRYVEIVARAFEGVRMIVCAKSRGDNDSRTIEVEAGFRDAISMKNVVICDDLVRSGGTVNECAWIVKNANPLSLNVCVIHAIFPDNSHEKFIDHQAIDRFYVSNTVPHVSTRLCGLKPFVVIDVSENISDAFDIIE